MIRWFPALRIARREAARAKGRTVLTVALIALPVAAVTFIAGLVASTTPTPATQIQWAMGESAQARVWAPSPTIPEDLQQNAEGSAVSYGETTGVDVDGESITRLRPGDVETAYLAALTAQSDTALIPRLTFYEVDATRVPGLLGEVEGESAPDAGEVVLQRQVATRLGVAVGDRIELSTREGGHAVDVVGIGDTSNGYAVGLLGPGSFAAGNISDANEAWFITGDPVTWSEIEELNTQGFAVTSRAIMTDPPPPADVYNGAFADRGPDLTTIGVLVAILGIGVLEVILLVGPAFAVGAKRSARNLALIAAAGGSPRDLRRIVLASGVFAGCAAAAAGIAVGAVALLVWFAFAARSIQPPANLVFPVIWPLAAGTFALVLGAIAAWIPANHAARTDVASVLAGRRIGATRKRSFPWLGLGIAGAGVLASLVAAVTRSAALLGVGGVTTLLGIVIASGVFIDLAGRFAPRARFVMRFALRDAARHRSRTAPALAAVLAAVAVATGGLIVSTTEGEAKAALWAPIAAEGTGLMYNFGPGDFDDVFLDAAEVITARLPDAELTQVNLLTGRNENEWWNIDPVAAPDTEDSEDSEELDGSLGPSPAMSGLNWGAGGRIVDDGTMISDTGLEGAREAARALAEGKVLVSSPADIWPDGAARIALDGGTGQTVGEELAVEAHLVDWSHPEYALVLPPEVAKSVSAVALGEDGEERLHVHTAGALVTGADLDQQTQDELNGKLSEIADNLSLEVEGRMYGTDAEPQVATLIVGATVVVALLATMLSIGLAMAESRADLATVSAVGAGPNIRRRIVAAQAGVIAVLGTGCGLLAGFMLGYVLANWQSIAYGPNWTLAVPWVPIASMAAGIPLLALIAGWLFAPSKLPLRNRAAE